MIAMEMKYGFLQLSKLVEQLLEIRFGVNIQVATQLL
jgi:hypothetical protein